MRTELKKINTVRDRFTATFVRFGEKKNNFSYRPIKTLLFEDIGNNGKIVADHIWFINNKSFESIQLKKGDRISFNARVKIYLKGYKGRKHIEDKPVSKDYKLSHPTNVMKIQGDSKQIPLF